MEPARARARARATMTIQQQRLPVQREEKAVTMSRNSSVKEKRLVNAGTQCSRNTTNSQRRPSHRDTEVKSKSKKLPHADGVKNVCPAVNSEAVS
nr:brain and acute leukemia cytoplasmic protein isoform X1 [Danio rerio]|eukprot:XP_021322417.1 brain and acute leukemia cytoplasmic protein isoform X1 [Danio rerio]